MCFSIGCAIVAAFLVLCAAQEDTLFVESKTWIEETATMTPKATTIVTPETTVKERPMMKSTASKSMMPPMELKSTTTTSTCHALHPYFLLCLLPVFLSIF